MKLHAVLLLVVASGCNSSSTGPSSAPSSARPGQSPASTPSTARAFEDHEDDAPKEAPTEASWRIWRQGRETISAKLAGIEKAVVQLELEANSSVVGIRLSELSASDQKYVMENTGWGRVWQDDSGSYRVIADLKEANKQNVRLEKMDGSVATVPLERLSKSDRQYAEARRLEMPLPDDATSLSGKVVSIADGDTITVLLGKQQHKVRFDGVDAPEMGQAFSHSSKQYVASVCFGQNVDVTLKGKDKYGRWIGIVMVGGVNLNEKLVEEGLAWHYTNYSDSERLAALESTAKSNEKGLWSEANPIPPWDWRRWGPAERKEWLAKRTNEAGAARGPPEQPARSIGSYWLNTSSNTRHNSSCRWYRNTKRGRACSSSEGKACGICGG